MTIVINFETRACQKVKLHFSDTIILVEFIAIFFYIKKKLTIIRNFTVYFLLTAQPQLHQKKLPKMEEKLLSTLKRE